MTALTQADALRLPLADDSVDLVVTSPPYFALRSYRDDDEHYDGQIGSEATPQEFLEALWAATVEMVRVVKPSGSIFVNLGDKYAGSNGQAGGPSQLNSATYSPDGTRTKAAKKGGYVPKTSVRTKSLMGLPWRYAIGCIDDLGLILRSEIVWSKPNGLPESVKDRVRRSHEQWFHFTLEPRYFTAIDEIREPHQGSVWSIPSEPLQVPDHLGVDHFAAFPQEWPRRLILGWCPESGVVLDPFAGTGTVPMVARALGRTGIGVDLSADYLRLANWRVFQSGHAAKTMRRTNAERQGALL